MKQKFVQNQPQSNIGLIGITSIIVADKKGNIRYKHIARKNAITDDLLKALAHSIYIGTVNPISSFGVTDSHDGIQYQPASAVNLGVILSTTSVSANATLPYVIYSGSRTISHDGNIERFRLGANWLYGTAVSAGSFAVDYASQTANIAVSSGDTISATWTVSCSTT